MISDHASEEAKRRGIDLEILDDVMKNPQQIVQSYAGRVIYQSKVEINEKLYLIRAIVELSEPLLVVTVYRTSQIERYWERE
ncbi:MAG: DUF4258 domain-containing protein [Anaerolineae bacterium]|nr:DUF4258 domain-containing protein [Anaerolineae bacterium]